MKVMKYLITRSLFYLPIISTVLFITGCDLNSSNEVIIESIVSNEESISNGSDREKSQREIVEIQSDKRYLMTEMNNQ